MKRFLLILLGLILAGCEGQATPIAFVATPSPTPEPTAIPIPELRYALAGNIASFVNDSDIPYEILSADTPLSDYDLVVAYGTYEGWQTSPQSHIVSLVINPNLSPLDNQTIRDLIPASINVQAIIDNLNIPGTRQTIALPGESSSVIRTSLANQGYPDGFQLTMATEAIPGIDILVSQFAGVSLDVRLIEYSETVFEDNQAHLALILRAEGSDTPFAPDTVIDLWTLPVSYLNNSGIAIGFTADGIPVPVR